MQKKVLLVLFMLFLPIFATAAGLEPANNLMTTVADWLRAAAIVTVTVAVMFVGYKILFGGSTLREMGPVIIGAILIASASFIASILMA